METNQIQVLKQTELLGQQFTVYGTAEEPLFLAKDIARMIEHSDVSMMMRSIDEEEKLIQTMFVAGQNREVLFLTEDGLYEILMQSRKPIAKQFKKGVKTILKEIRKNGGYISAKQDETPEQILARAVIVAQATIDRVQEKNKVLQEEIKHQAPKVLFADAVASGDKDILIGELAKILRQNGCGIGEKRLFEYLREHGYLCKRGSAYNQPTQRSMELGIFKITKSSITTASGQTIITTTTKVTPKGQIYFVCNPLIANI